MSSFSIGQRVTGPNGEQGVVQIVNGQPHIVVLGNSPSVPMQKPTEDGLAALTTDTQNKQILAQRANEFAQAQGQPGQAGYAATSPWNGNIDIPIPLTHQNIEFSPVRMYNNIMNPHLAAQLQDLDGINAQTWAMMRPENSGRMSNSEIEGFKQSFPNTDNWTATNQAREATLNQESQQSTQKLQFIDGFVRAGLGDFSDAQAAWMKGQAGNVGMTQLPPVQGQGQFGQPTAGAQYNSGVPLSSQGQTPPVSQSPAATPMAPQQQPRVLNWNPQTGNLE